LPSFLKRTRLLRAVKAANEYSPITLDLAVAEIGNAAWKRVAFFKEGKEATWLSLSKCLQFISFWYRGREDPRLQAGDESYPCHDYFRHAPIDLI